MADKPNALPPLLPTPRDLRPGVGHFRIRPGLPIVLEPGADEGDEHAARALRDAIVAATGTALPIEGHGEPDDLGPRIELRRRPDDTLGPQAYRASVSPVRVEVVAGGAPGLRYAAETLAQLIDARGRIPACEIEDAPTLPRRGVMLDVSRGKVPTVAALRDVVDVCVRLKLNVLMLYTEHTFRFRRHPEIGEDASPLDADAMRELDAYAAERHVDLVPTLQSLGHMRHVLKLETYRHLAETDRLWTLAPVDPGTYQLLSDLYAEYLPNFRSRWFNANCDEPVDLGKGRSAERGRQLGPGGLYLEHVRRIRDMAQPYGKRTMIWGDVVHAHPDRIREIDRDLLLLDWWYESRGDFERVKRFAENGIEFWVCPGTSTWNCLFPRVRNSIENVSNLAEAGRRHGTTGLVNTDWGDHGHYNLQGNSWLGYAWGAQEAWSGPTEARDFDRAFSRLLFGDASGTIARLYRELGDTHDVGLPILNGSLLQYLFFDDVGPAHFLCAAEAPKLRRTRKKLERVRARIEEAEERFARESATRDEMLWAADASLCGVDKGLAGLEWLAWRRRPESLDARGRKKLAARLREIADAQVRLGRRLRTLWDRRARPGGFEVVKGRLDGSVRSLRAAAKSLEKGAPPDSAPPERFDYLTAYQALTRQIGVSGPILS